MMKVLDDYFPTKNINKYLEVFTGGGSVLFHAIQRYKPSLVYANDIDTNLINYYNGVKDNPEKVISECIELKNKYDKNSFKSIFKELDKSIPSNFLALNRSSFSGISNSFSPTAFDDNFNMSSINSVNEISKIIKNVNFINSDFKDLDEVIPEKIEGFFIYLDPPYYGNRNKGLYGNKGVLHKDFDHEGLFEWVKKHSENNLIMISYDNDKHIREVYKDYYLYDFDFTYCMTNPGGNKAKTGKELVIVNYDLQFNPLF